MIDVAGVVFTELRTIFGPAFTLEHGEQPSAMWRAAIARLTVAEVELGIQAFLGQTTDPPNLTQFVHVCRGGTPGRYFDARSPLPTAPPSAPDVTEQVQTSALDPDDTRRARLHAPVPLSRERALERIRGTLRLARD